MAGGPVTSMPGEFSPVRAAAVKRQGKLTSIRAGSRSAVSRPQGRFAGVMLAAIDLTDVRLEDQARAMDPGVPTRIGIERPLPGGVVTPETHGEWLTMDDGSRVWRIRLEAPDARALRVHFSAFNLPPDTRVVVSDETATNGKAYRGRGPARDGTLWSQVTSGAAVIIEFQDPTGQSPAPTLVIDRISHLYENPTGLALPASAEAAQGLLPCHEDVNCHDVDPIAQASVGRMLFNDNGTFVCTGSLLNDTDANTFAGYFLTANHCLSTQTVASTIEVLWFYESTVCDGLRNSGPTSNGGTLLATNPSSDFTLIRLANDPQDGQGLNAWNLFPPSGKLASIHHPGGNFSTAYKRVALSEDGRTTVQPICGNLPIDRYWYLDWTTGITEGGSSGAPLFNANWEVVGQLFGVCFFSTPGCSNPQDYNNVYGRFNVSYNSMSSILNMVTPDDAFEDNDSLAQAASLGIGTHPLRLVDFDDYWLVRACADDVLTITATFDTADMDLDLRLLSSDGTLLDSSTGNGAIETISTAVAAGDYIIRVNKDAGWGGDYSLEIAVDVAVDCNGNGQPDSCDILDGDSPDNNGDGIPDECVSPPGIPPPPHSFAKNRFVSIAPNTNPGQTHAIRVQWLDRVCQVTGSKCLGDVDCLTCDGGEACVLDSDCAGGSCVPSGEACEDATPPTDLGWVGTPFDPAIDRTPPGTFTAEVVTTGPVFRRWTEEVVHIADCEIAPAQHYALSATSDGVVFSEPLELSTVGKPRAKLWGDLVGSFDGIGWTAPNGLVDLDDVMAMVNYLSGKPAPHITVVEIAGDAPTFVNFVVNATDLALAVQGFEGESYPPPPFIADGYPIDGDLTRCNGN